VPVTLGGLGQPRPQRVRFERLNRRTDPAYKMSSSVTVPNSASAPPLATEVIPAEVRELLGPAPLTSTEDAAAYERILSQMALAVSPSDFVEWTWVKELVDLTWEAARARRAKAVRLALARKAAIHRILEADWFGHRPNRSHWVDQLWEGADQVYRGDEGPVAAFDAALERLGLSKNALEDAAYLTALEEVQSLQDLADNANSRRDAVLREIERRRDAIAARARKATETIEPAIDAVFE
jgi:hypothetical protein